MKQYFILLVALLLLAGCAGKTETTKPVTVQTGQQTATQTQEQTQEQTLNIVSMKTDANALVDACLKPGVDVCMAKNFAKGKIGDTLIIGYGISNIMTNEEEFMFNITFFKVQDKFGSGTTTADKTTMLQWTKETDFLGRTYTIKSMEKQLLPITVKIGQEIAPNVPTKPGTYIFNIRAYRLNKGFKEDYGAVKEFSIAVE